MKPIKPEIIAAVFLLGILFAVYFVTAPPTVSLWDSSELITTSYIMGIPHPPGSPLLSLINRTVMVLLPENLRGPGSDQAFNANIVAITAGAMTALLTYLLTINLLVKISSGNDTPFQRYARIFCGLLAGFMAGFSDQFWENSTETEAYMPALFISMLALFLIMKREERKSLPNSVTYLFTALFLLGLGLGIHLYSLLVLPSVLILIFIQSPAFFKSPSVWITTIPAAVFYLVIRKFGGHGYIALISGIISVAGPYAAWKIHKNATTKGKIYTAIMVTAVSLFCLGYSVYPTVMVRASKNPVINQGSPSGLKSFDEYLSREQYGQGNMFAGIFQRNADADYQFNFMYLRYLIRQFPKWGPNLKIIYSNTGAETQRNTAAGSGGIVYFPIFIALILIIGLVFHAVKDLGRFSAFFAYFLMSSIGLVLYLNMENPQVRERDYFFLGSFQIINIWLGIGVYGLFEIMRKYIKGKTLITVTSIGSILIATMILVAVLSNHLDPAYTNWSIHNRSKNFIAYDYAINTLNSCEENAVLFSHGDNDTFPLWYAQFVRGIRKDVTVVNLSLLNAPWYVKQLRDGPSRLPIEFTDNFIDDVIGGKSIAAYKYFLWTPVPKEIARAGITWLMPPSYVTSDGETGYLIPADLNILEIIDKNDWKRPLYFSTYISYSRLLGLTEYLSMEGLVYRLTNTKSQQRNYYTIYPEILSRNLFEIYIYRGISDSGIYKTPEIKGIIQNYFISCIELSEKDFDAGRREDGIRDLKKAYEFTLGIPERIQLVEHIAGKEGLSLEFLKEK